MHIGEKVAKRKYPKSQETNFDDVSAYVSWDSTDEAQRQAAIASYGEAVSEFSYASLGSRRRDFSDLTSNLSGRPGIGQQDVDWFRPGQAVPTKSKEIIAFARTAYRRIGLIRNAIDLMGDFACQGIRLVHRNPRIEKFYNDWFSRVKGPFVSERVCNLLFREANVPIRMKTAKLNKQKRLKMQKSFASPDMQATLNDKKFQKGEIPWQYLFLDPLLVEPVGGVVSNMIGNRLYKMKIPAYMKKEVRKLQGSRKLSDQQALAQIPQDVLRAVETNEGVILPPEKTFMFHYKKDDWQAWADPMTYACFKDLLLYEKLKLADQAALDGAISKIRVWKLGNLDHKLAPTAAAASALGDILGTNVGGGTMDIVWGPDIELIETGTDVQRFLGAEKYHPTLMAIYACLGIPPTLTGTFGASGTTNNFISLKTLTERLNYVRNILLDFWNEQVRIVQESMGFRFPAEVEFDFMYLDDPASMTQLMINLADRNIISDEFVQRNIKATPSVERKRLQNEEKRRDRGTMSEKVSPFHAVDKDFSLEKIALQTGVASPSEVGLDLNDRRDGEEPALEMRRPKDKKKPSQDKEQQQLLPFKDDSNPPSTEGPGRPKNSRDLVQRERRTFKPKRKASIELWAREAQDKISKAVNSVILDGFGKKNMRSLSSEESTHAEMMKFEILLNLSHEEEVSEDRIFAAIAKDIDQRIHHECNSWISEASEQIGRRLSIEEIRNLRAAFYSEYAV
jgi:hypothetical protein